MARKKKTKGKQKIEIKRIMDEDDRIITFSKRRSGIYKKASDLVTLCGVEIGILVFSPAGKPFSFGHPSLESITNRLLGQNPHLNDKTHPLIEAHRRMRVYKLTEQHNEMLSSLEAEIKRGEWLNSMLNGRSKQTTHWWDVPIHELTVEELQKTHAMFEDIHTNLCKKLTEASINGACSSILPPPPPPPLVNHNNNNPTMMNNPLDDSNANQNQLSSIPHGYGFGKDVEPQESSLRKFYPRLG
ncbi:Agamous-like MADS-box protein AGL61 [Euphorbia peplus]|nr:Agamous-like MADS-box protein AGL61 [Euphorbia peplus]